MNKEVVKCLIPGEHLSNILGIGSSIVWFFVLIPQLFINYKKQNSDAISLSLILLWIVGDIFSMMSAQIKGISYVVIYIAIYHIVIGVLFVIQIIWQIIKLVFKFGFILILIVGILYFIVR